MTALEMWPLARAGEALVALAAAAGLPVRAAELGDAPSTAAALEVWLDEAGAWLGLEVEPVQIPHEHLERALVSAGPALIRINRDGEHGVIAVLGGRRDRIEVLAPSLQRTAISAAALAAVLGRAAVAEVEPAVERLVTRAKLAGSARARAMHALTDARLRGTAIEGMYLLRRPPEATPRDHARDHRLVPRLSWLLVVHAIAQALWLGSWWAIGRAVLFGTISSGWLAAWALLLTSASAARVLVTWWSGRIAIDGAMLLSQRLLAGALRIDPDVLKREGIGGALGRVLESAAIQHLAVTGGIQAALSAVEVVLAAGLLAAGAGGALHVAILVAVLAAGVLAMRGYVRERRAWTARRLELTHELTEAMVGHATRIAQGDLDVLADRDDRGLARYLTGSRALDRASARLGVLVPLAWPILAAIGLAPALLLGAPTAGEIAAALGGVLFAADALNRLAAGAARIADARVAWTSIAELFAAAAHAADRAPPALALSVPSTSAPAIAIRAVTYRHRGRGAPVLAGCDLVIAPGERVLLDAPSGSGKSTLAAILAGLRRPDSGLVLAAGLDRASVGARGWRRRVAYAPQFHDNHVFGGTLAFNLLMGRAWPPTPADLALAETTCRELGLGPVVDRMPAGLLEQVGETGWQLSHGERSRVFLARALLQEASVVLFDESLAALDPANLALALDCIEARAPTAIVIAHP